MKAKILVVEDDAGIARVVRDTFLRDGYEVTWATSGLEGLEDFQKGAYYHILSKLLL
ncbi:response regulator [Ureibacillus massiliensis]|uniref:response regulator n=1 Tax=Ureibacillus massiliensis TaxID=292806 RepID=UPI000AE454AD|nr:response regulator [Ureibacillus massiliensis]